MFDRTYTTQISIYGSIHAAFFLALVIAGGLAGCSAEAPPEKNAPPRPPVSEQPTADSRQPASDSPNIVIISIDTFRADRIERDPSITPNIDRLAREGVTFDQAVTPIGTTLPALASVFTGLHPREHGLQWNGHSLRPEFNTLAELFQRNSYATAAFVSFYDALYGGGLGQGFDARVDVTDPRATNLPAEEVNRQALTWLRAPRTEPIFFWVHYLEPHAPYRMTAYAKERLPDLTGIYQNGASVTNFYKYNEPGMGTPENREILNILYDGEVFEVDRAVGEILEAVDGLESDRETVVILTADHGQLLGEHNVVGHGFTVWKEILHIPLIVRDSRREGARRVSTRVGLIDLFPTIVELAGFESAQNISGRSIVPALDGEPMPEIHYYAETRIPPPPTLETAVMYGDRKLQKFKGTIVPYDLLADPHESEPASPDAVDGELARRLNLFASRQQTSEIASPLADSIEVGRNDRLIALGYAVEPDTPAQATPDLSPQQAVEIIHEFSSVLQDIDSNRHTVYDVTLLPHSKDQIQAALTSILAMSTDPKERSYLRTAVLSLAFFQSGVGENGIPLDVIGPSGQPWRGAVEAEMRDIAAILARRGL